MVGYTWQTVSRVPWLWYRQNDNGVTVGIALRSWGDAWWVHVHKMYDRMSTYDYICRYIYIYIQWYRTDITAFSYCIGLSYIRTYMYRLGRQRSSIFEHQLSDKPIDHWTPNPFTPRPVPYQTFLGPGTSFLDIGIMKILTLPSLKLT